MPTETTGWQVIETACDPAATREEFDARFDAELAAMKADETADE